MALTEIKLKYVDFMAPLAKKIPDHWLAARLNQLPMDESMGKQKPKQRGTAPWGNNPERNNPAPPSSQEKVFFHHSLMIFDER